MADTDDHSRLSWLNQAVAAHNAQMNETVITFAEKVIATEGGDPSWERMALALLLMNAPNDSMPNRMPMAAINQRYVAALRADPRFQQLPVWRGRGERSPGPLRIGYFWDFIGLSVDFCFPAFHNRQRYQVIGVTCGGRPRRLEGLEFDRVIEFDPENLPGAVELIRGADLDLLIDLNGRGNSDLSDLLIEARLAVRQAMYGNFFWSTQSSAIDLLIADRGLLAALNPETTRETLVAIEEPIMAVSNPRGLLSDGRRPAPMRPRRYRIGTPGNSNKLSDAFLDLLAQVLAAIPDCSFFYHSCSSPEFEADLRRRLLSRGIEEGRLELFVRGQIDYVDGVNAMDAALDSIPYNGHLSSVEYLSLGTPIWSLCGESLTQRYGAMILGHVGLEANLFTDGAALSADLSRRLVVKEPYLAADLAKRVARSGISDPLRVTRLFEKAIEACLLEP